MNWTLTGTLFVVALLACSMGFKRFVWFMSIGYGLAVAAIAVATLVAGAGITGNPLTPGLVVALLVCLAYGLRLGVFLWRREMGNANYRKVLATKVGKEPPVFVKALAWLFMGALYVCETAGLHLRLANGTPDDAALWVGVAVMAVGAVIEAVADQQKSAQKEAHPDMVATEGLFSVVRCPNYLGEMLFWTGVFVTGVPSYAGVVQWVVALVGYVGILFVMVDGARRMKRGHEQRYGSDARYRAYAERTKLVIPFVW
ncbi:DUF1295 domain-containing protein [Olsenella profusa]|uniref:DUF1295 domain-containing protein n=1 Tax=Olsenella profusa TaxID=138595 RepID=A0ABS2F2I8_9ACTN|nr:DUF1295 domain-containing protein [Olsenella profusa]MBM6775030.1 DUF1295 domain-containing protein [Olsenella profusa]